MADKNEINPAVIPLDNLDAILAKEDPEFAKSVSEIKVDNNPEVEIETLNVDADDMQLEGDFEEQGSKPTKPLSRVSLTLKKIREGLYARKLRFQARLKMFRLAAFEFLKTQPKRIFVNAVARMTALAQLVQQLIGWLTRLSLKQKLMMVGSGVCLVGAFFALRVQLPSFDEPLLSSLSEIADHVYTFNSNADLVNLYQAFPQPQVEVLFDKMVVNLKRVTGNDNPMGAFEFYVAVDSKEAAIEIRDRQKQLSDAVQRSIESATYAELNGPTGSERLKTLIKDEVNRSLTQGWVKSVYLKTLILKP